MTPAQRELARLLALMLAAEVRKSVEAEAAPRSRTTRDGRSLRELFEAELQAHGITWCRGGCDGSRSHNNGGAFASGRTVHYNREIATRATLQTALHEVAHIVLGHTERTPAGHRRGNLRAYEREAAAEAWSFQRMRELGVPVPRKSRARAHAYVARTQRHGDAIRNANRRTR